MWRSFSNKFKKVTPSDITFIDLLKEKDDTCVFQVTVKGEMCILKVYCVVEKLNYMIYNREIDPFTCESNAYQRLKSKGLCEQGVIPDFYGVIENINPKEAEWEPYLEKFVDEELPLNAVLMEYIPNMHQIDLSTYSEERLEKLHAILKEIHAAGVLHDDLYPRNMMVQVDTDRVLWIDFDRAQTFVEGAITKMQQEWIDFEKALMEEFVKFLKLDYLDGKIDRTLDGFYS